MRSADYRALVARFSGKRVLVFGDMVADEYIVGRPARISREAPILILHHSDTFVRPGGATNPACNLVTLSARCAVFGVVGDDEMGRRLRTILERMGVDTEGLLIDPHRPTSTKTRILGKGVQEVQQQIVRIDRLDGRDLDESLQARLTERLQKAMKGADALLISDYEIGVISPGILDACLSRARSEDLRVVVDSHGDLFRFKGVTAATPNQPEAEATLGRIFATLDDLCRGGEELLDGMDTQAVLITRGSDGLALFERDRSPYVLPVALDGESQVVDPTGAGDTVSAVFTLALCAGASMRQAAYLSDVAGGEVVRKLGAATLAPTELTRATERSHLEPPE